MTTYTVPTSIQHSAINYGNIVYLPGHASYVTGTDVTDAIMWWFTHDETTGALELGPDGYMLKSGSSPASPNLILFQPNVKYWIENGLNIGAKAPINTVRDSSSFIVWPSIPRHAWRNIIFDLNGSTLIQEDDTLSGNPTGIGDGDITLNSSIITNLTINPQPYFLPGATPNISPQVAPYVELLGNTYIGSKLMANVRPTPSASWLYRQIVTNKKIIAQPNYITNVDTINGTITMSNAALQTGNNIYSTLQTWIGQSIKSSLIAINVRGDALNTSATISNCYGGVQIKWIGETLENDSIFANEQSIIADVDESNNTITASDPSIITATQQIIAMSGQGFDIRGDVVQGSVLIENAALHISSKLVGRSIKGSAAVNGVGVLKPSTLVIQSVSEPSQSITVTGGSAQVTKTNTPFDIISQNAISTGAKVSAIDIYNKTVTMLPGTGKKTLTAGPFTVVLPLVQPRRTHGVTMFKLVAPGSLNGATPGTWINKNIVIQNGTVEMGNEFSQDAVPAGREPWHAFTIRAVKGLIIRDIIINNIWGDFFNTGNSYDIYNLSVDYQADDILIQRVNGRACGRHAFTLQGNQDFVVKDSTFLDIQHWVIDVESFTGARMMNTSFDNNDISIDGFGMISWHPTPERADAPTRIDGISMINGSVFLDITSGSAKFSSFDVGCRIIADGIGEWNYIKRFHSFTKVELNEPVTQTRSDISMVMFDSALMRGWRFTNNRFTNGNFTINGTTSQRSKVFFTANSIAGSPVVSNVVMLPRDDGSYYYPTDLLSTGKVYSPTQIFSSNNKQILAYSATPIIGSTPNIVANSFLLDTNAIQTTNSAPVRRAFNISNTSNSALLNSATPAFNPTDVGLIVKAVAPAVLSSTARVLQYISSTQVKLTNTISASNSGYSVDIGGDILYNVTLPYVVWSDFYMNNNVSVNTSTFGGRVAGIALTVPMLLFPRYFANVTITNNSFPTDPKAALPKYIVGYTDPPKQLGGFGTPPGAQNWIVANNYWAHSNEWNQATPSQTASLTMSVSPTVGDAGTLPVATIVATTSDGKQMPGNMGVRYATSLNAGANSTSLGLGSIYGATPNRSIATPRKPLPAGRYYLQATWPGSLDYRFAQSPVYIYDVFSGGATPTLFNSNPSLLISPATPNDTQTIFFSVTITN